ncbi:MAG: hypothetical protein GY861_02995 [bacterium]|nr:hypothetical protein [bacterium]
MKGDTSTKIYTAKGRKNHDNTFNGKPFKHLANCKCKACKGKEKANIKAGRQLGKTRTNTFYLTGIDIG